jgi:hypothetical protein
MSDWLCMSVSPSFSHSLYSFSTKIFLRMHPGNCQNDFSIAIFFDNAYDPAADNVFRLIVAIIEDNPIKSL